MVYTQKQIKFIQEKRPDLRFQRIPTLDDLIVDFLKKFDIIVNPASNNDLINSNYSYLNFDENKKFYLKKNEINEWQHWKKWTLEHLDFEEFRVRKIKENQIYNRNVLKKINGNDVKEEFKNIFEKSSNFNKLFVYGLILLTILFPLTIIMLNLLQDKNNLNTAYFYENTEQPLFINTNQ